MKNTRATLKILLAILLLAVPCFSQTTGGAGNANRVNFPGDFSRVGVTSLAHLYCARGFADSSVTIALTTGIYVKVTNAFSSLYTTVINRGFTIQGDSIQIPVSGDYRIHRDESASNVQANDELHFEIYVNAVGQSGAGESHNEVGFSGTDVQVGGTIFNLTAGDWVHIRVKNATAGDRDVVMEAGNIVIEGKYAN